MIGTSYGIDLVERLKRIETGERAEVRVDAVVGQFEKVEVLKSSQLVECTHACPSSKISFKVIPSTAMRCLYLEIENRTCSGGQEDCHSSYRSGALRGACPLNSLLRVCA